MKQVLNVVPRDKLSLSDLENQIKSARASNDYIVVNFGRKGEYIKISFHKDQTYNIGYNFWNMEFAVKTNVMLKQYPKINVPMLANWLFTAVNKLNR